MNDSPQAKLERAKALSAKGSSPGKFTDNHVLIYNLITQALAELSEMERDHEAMREALTKIANPNVPLGVTVGGLLDSLTFSQQTARAILESKEK